MSSQGPNNPGTCVSDNSPPFGIAWQNPGNAAASDGSYTTSQLTLVGSSNQKILQVYNFGFSIPTGSTINGIVAEVQRAASTSGCSDLHIKMIQGLSYVGTDHAALGDWPTSEAYTTYGSSTDLWGVSWAVSDINSTSFGVAISAQINDGTSTPIAEVDHVRMTVYYTPPLQPLSYYTNLIAVGGF